MGNHLKTEEFDKEKEFIVKLKEHFAEIYNAKNKDAMTDCRYGFSMRKYLCGKFPRKSIEILEEIHRFGQKENIPSNLKKESSSLEIKIEDRKYIVYAEIWEGQANDIDISVIPKYKSS